MSLSRKTPMKRSAFKPKKVAKPCPTLKDLQEKGLVVKASSLSAKPRKRLKPRSASNKGWVDVAKAIWDEPGNSHCCEVCGVWLGDDFSPAFYHHLLHRGSYRRLSRSPLNMPQVCLADHDKAHEYTVEALAKKNHPHQGKWKELHERMIYMRANNIQT
jgi:hypothetical protein